jgi:hypothetical protein
MSQPQEIFVRGPNWTGDLIMATPGFRALRSELVNVLDELEGAAGAGTEGGRGGSPPGLAA